MSGNLSDPLSMSGEGFRGMSVGLSVFGRGLADLGDRDPRIVAGSADLKVSTLFVEFAQRHPERFFQFGISERNMVSAAAGLATTGLLPYVSTFASFASLMCAEQIRTDLCYTGLPVRVVGTHAGISMGYFATSHHATEDLALLRPLAGLTILSPPDGATAAALARDTADWPGPIYFRLGRGRDEGTYERVPDDYTPGVAHVARRGGDVLIVSTGLTLTFSLRAAELLAAGGIQATVLDVHTIKPFPHAQVAALAAEHPAVLTVEEHTVEGGLGTLVREACFQHRVAVAVVKHGLFDEHAIIGPPNDLYRYYGLDAEGIATVTTRLLEQDEAKSDLQAPLWREADRLRVLEASNTGGSGSWS